MQFVNPNYLYGLFAIAIPILIHLFNFRRFRKVYFTNVRFLKDLKQQTQKQSQLRHLLILASRILAIAALVFAFAQPYIPSAEIKGKIASRNIVSVFVDNSFSMEAIGSEGSVFEEAKKKAKEIALAYRTSDLFQLLSCDFEGHQQRLVSRDEFFTLLNDLKISSSTRTLSEIVHRQYDLLQSQGTGKRSAYIVSDFQKSSFNTASLTPDSSVATYFIPVIPSVNTNVYIDSCWFAQPTQQAGRTILLTARIQNKSKTDLEKIPLKLLINNQQKAISSIDIKAGSFAEVELPFTIYETGHQKGLLQVTDYPVTYDDKFYFAFDVMNSVSVLCINGGTENVYLNALFKQDSAVKLTNANEKMLDYSKFSNFNLIVLNELSNLSSGLSQEIKKFVLNGGSILLLPAENADLQSYNNFASSLSFPSYLSIDTSVTKVDQISEESVLFRDVFETAPGQKAINNNTDLPIVLKHFPIVSGTGTMSLPLIKMINGRTFLSQTITGNGQIFQLAIPINTSFSNFPRQALFVPVLYNIALLSNPTHRLYSFIGDNKSIRLSIPPPGGDKVYILKSATDGIEIIPQLQQSGSASNLFVGNLITKADNYQLLNAGKEISTLAFNYNRSESDPACNTEGELTDLIDKEGLSQFKILKAGQKPLNDIIRQMNAGTQLWKYLIGLALLFLFTEVLLIRFRK